LWHTGTGREVFEWNWQTRKAVPNAIDVTDMRLLEYSLDGVCWAVRDSSELGVWDSRAGFQPRWDNSLAKVVTGRRRIHALAATRRLVAVGTNDGAVVVFQRSADLNLKEQLRIDCHAPVTALAFDPAEETLIFGTEQGKLGIVRPSTNVEPELIDAHDKQVEGLAFSSNTRLASAGHDQQILLWEIDEKGQLTQALSLRPQLGPLAKVRFSPDGAKLYALAKESFALHVWDLKQLGEEFDSRFGPREQGID
jgi:WD40 repeat protein